MQRSFAVLGLLVFCGCRQRPPEPVQLEPCSTVAECNRITQFARYRERDCKGTRDCEQARAYHDAASERGERVRRAEEQRQLDEMGAKNKAQREEYDREQAVKRAEEAERQKRLAEDSARRAQEQAARREQLRQAEEEAATKKAAELEAARTELEALAKRHHLEPRPAEDGGIGGAVEMAIRDAVPLSELRKYAIALSDNDARFAVTSTKLGLLENGDGLSVMVRGETVPYEDTPLTSLGFTAVQIVGTISYRLTNGGSRQAFVVVPLR